MIVAVVVAGAACVPPPPPAATALAIAYTNVDGIDGYDEAGGDVLIARLEDTNDDGVVSVGDAVVTGQYPEDFAATTFGSFAVTRHVVDAVAGASSVRVGDFKFVWSDIADAEVYSEFNFINDPLGTATEFTDSFSSVGPFGEGIFVNTTSPSVPDSNVNMSRAQQASDDEFIDVDILIP
jgi:hypothetical protein